jgi:hypothetical protein
VIPVSPPQKLEHRNVMDLRSSNSSGEEIMANHAWQALGFPVRARR